MTWQADPMRCTVSKTLTCFTWGPTYWELNSFKGASHVAILEVRRTRSLLPSRRRVRLLLTTPWDATWQVEAESVNSRISMPDFVQVGDLARSPVTSHA